MFHGARVHNLVSHDILIVLINNSNKKVKHDDKKDDLTKKPTEVD